MSFVLKMAWRDSRASRRRLLFFSLSIVLGIAALVSIGSFGANLRQAIDWEAKGLLGADLFVTSPAPLGRSVSDYLTALSVRRASERMFSSMMSFPTAHGALRLVQVRAMEGDFPFYGDFVTSPASAAARLRRGGRVVVLEETLLTQFGVKVGDSVALGRSSFTVIGALKQMPGESAGVGLLAPRAFIPMEALAATGLATPQALARYRVMLQLPAAVDPDAIVHAMRERFASARLSFDTVAERKRELGRALTNIDGFLSLVGFIALVLGGIGVASALHTHVRQKIATVAVLRCLGASARQSFLVYLLQGLALGVAGAGIGAVAGVAVQTVLPRFLRGVLPFAVNFFISWRAVGEGMAAGVAVCALFSLFPLLAIRRISPLAALRSSVAEEAGSGWDRWGIALAALLAIAVAAIAVGLTGRLSIGLGFAVGLGVAFGLLAGLARVVAWSARRFAPRRLPYVFRQGLANLHRPQNRTVLLLLSLGLGTFLVLTLFLARTTLLREVLGVRGAGRPDLLFFDIQTDQIEPLARLLAAQGAPVLDQAALVTMRISSVRGREVEALVRERGDGRGDGRGDSRGDSIPAWTLRREYRSTFRDHLGRSERIVQGRFTGRVAPGTDVAPISIEESLFKEMHLKLGDEIDWDVQGLPVRTRVGSVRAVEWRRLEPNFYVVFPAGILEDAPRTYVAAVRAGDAAESGRVQRAVVGAFPNVTAIDLALLVETLDGIFSKVAFAIEFMALFTAITGVLVLAGAVLTGRFQRVRETVLLRTLGASRRQVKTIQAVEYGVLGVLAALVGTALAVVANLLLARYVFQTEAATPPLQLAAAVAATTTLTLAVGWVSNRGIADYPPLEVLRQET